MGNEPHRREPSPDLRDLGVIGDRRTAALIDRRGNVVWWCPERFDRPSLFAALLDPAAGAWRLDLPGAEPAGRRYAEDSGVLETRLRSPKGRWSVTDWLTTGDAPEGLFCRLFSPAPAPARVVLSPRPGYGRRTPEIRITGLRATIDGRWAAYASHPLSAAEGEIRLDLPAGEPGWMVLAERPLETPPWTGLFAQWLAATLARWREIGARASYHGPYEREVRDSIRALRLLTYEPNGGVIAAPTTSLPETPGGGRNYDYRYVWLRDAAMIVSALTRAGGEGVDERRFLGFVCSTRGAVEGMTLPPFATLDGTLVPEEETLDLAGWAGSRAVRIGNRARAQLQLDGFGNVLLAAKLIYGRHGEREHWDVVRAVAEELAERWREPDHGLWEEEKRLHYTSSKVIAACGLDSIAEFTEDETEARRWRAAVRDIRVWVAEHCLTTNGAYASAAGGERVDVSAALFPVWNYTAPDAPEMLATMAALERDHSPDGLLYRRTLEDADAGHEGAFLAGTFWVAQYWVMRGALDRARRILDTGLACANDLGLFAEEAEPETGRMLGNFPQTFVHAAFIGAVVDLKAAMEEGRAAPRPVETHPRDQEI